VTPEEEAQLRAKLDASAAQLRADEAELTEWARNQTELKAIADSTLRTIGEVLESAGKVAGPALRGLTMSLLKDAADRAGIPGLPGLP
jgi:hypothetical protein